jgi:hypothetical protein
MYDYFLGGTHNFPVDRELARRIIAVDPDIRAIVRANRAFLLRVVRYLVSQGIRQFIDIGSGVPAVDNVHEAAPEARVIYVDRDPVAVAHSRLMLRDNPNARILQADLRQLKELLQSPELAELIDPAQPVAVLLVAVLHFVPEEAKPQEGLRQLLETVAPGSFLVISHGVSEGLPPEAPEITRLFNTADPVTLRSRDQVRDLFQGWELVEPGLVGVPDWRPDPTDRPTVEQASLVLGAVGRKPSA